MEPMHPPDFLLKKKTKHFIDFRERKERSGGGEREREMCCSTLLPTHWLILVCALTRDRTHNLSISWDNTKQLSTQPELPHAFLQRHLMHFMKHELVSRGKCKMLTSLNSKTAVLRMHSAFAINTGAKQTPPGRSPRLLGSRQRRGKTVRGAGFHCERHRPRCNTVAS